MCTPSEKRSGIWISIKNENPARQGKPSSQNLSAQQLLEQNHLGCKYQCGGSGRIRPEFELFKMVGLQEIKAFLWFFSPVMHTIKTRYWNIFLFLNCHDYKIDKYYVKKVESWFASSSQRSDPDSHYHNAYRQHW